MKNGGIRRAIPPYASTLAAALAPDLTHDIGDHPGQALGEIVDLATELVDFAVHAVNFLFDTTEARLYGSEVVAVAAGLFENMARDELLALDFTFEDVEFFSADICGH
jgi:hypothetical protein